MAEKRESNTNFDGNKPSITIKPNRPVTEKKKQIGKLTIDIDCSEALKGLKAVTREAKKATVALKELEKQQAKMEVNTKVVGIVDTGLDVRDFADELDKQLQKARARGASF